MQPEQSDLGNVLCDDAVLSFLTRNPEFFVNNQDILPRLKIPHDAGNAVSLIEKQVSVLRGKCSTLENSLRDLIAVARENESLHQRLHVLIQEVISATTLEQIVSLTRSSLRENFNADDVHLLLVASKPKRASTRKSSKASEASKSSKTSAASAATRTRRARTSKPVEGMRIIAHNHKSLNLFSELFECGETVCGLPSEDHLSCLVGKDYANIASAALIPLQHERSLGIVMLTSRDESRFASGKGVMFLNQLGQLLSRRLHTFGAIAPAAAK
ncbi:MAG: DUF484 family protein [Granulosicoccus sp.]|nr:DUF484 family protein [Granulosicoccus sp.]